jgi:hypothetical protein
MIKIVKFFQELSGVGHVSLTETFVDFQMKITGTENVTDVLNKIPEIQSLLSNSDKLECLIEIDGNQSKAATEEEFVSTNLFASSFEQSRYDDFELVLVIRKNPESNVLTVYHFKCFADFLVDLNTKTCLKWFSSKADAPIVFDIKHDFDSFDNGYLYFCSWKVEENFKNSKISDRDKRLELFHECVPSYDLPEKLTPDHFNFDNRLKQIHLGPFFSKLKSLLSLVFLANSSSLNNDKYIKYKISGYKTLIRKDLSLDELATSTSLLYKIYDWCYEGGNGTDKIGLARNVLSLHADENGNLLLTPDVWQAIESNYKIYLQGNIQSYLEIKGKINDVIFEACQKSYSLIDDFLDAIKKNIIIFITLVVSMIVIKGLRESTPSIFSNEYFIAVIITSTFSTSWLYLFKSEAEKRQDSYSDKIIKTLKLSYGKILMESEIEDTARPIVEENKTYLKEQLDKFFYFWLCSIVVVNILYIVVKCLI